MNMYYYKGWDQAKPSYYLMDIDANALYGYCMMQPLLTKGFQWYTAQQIKDLVLQNFPDDGPIGLLLEVDYR